MNVILEGVSLALLVFYTIFQIKVKYEKTENRKNWCLWSVCSSDDLKKKKWAATRQNQQNECAPSEDSDQPRHPPSLIRVFAVRMKKPWILSYPMSAQRRRWSDWADAQADLSLCWAHTHFVGFVMSWLIFGQCLSGTAVLWAASWQNQQNGMRTQRRLRSAWASAQSDQGPHCVLNG